MAWAASPHQKVKRELSPEQLVHGLLAALDRVELSSVRTDGPARATE